MLVAMNLSLSLQIIHVKASDLVNELLFLPLLKHFMSFQYILPYTYTNNSTCTTQPITLAVVVHALLWHQGIKPSIRPYVNIIIKIFARGYMTCISTEV